MLAFHRFFNEGVYLNEVLLHWGHSGFTVVKNKEEAHIRETRGNLEDWTGARSGAIQKPNKEAHVWETRRKFMFSWLTIWFICVPLNKLHIKKMCFIKSTSFSVSVFIHKQKFGVNRFCSLKKVKIVIELVWHFVY